MNFLAKSILPYTHIRGDCKCYSLCQDRRRMLLFQVTKVREGVLMDRQNSFFSIPLYGKSCLYTHLVFRGVGCNK